MQPAVAEIRAGQSIELLKELHIETRDGKLNQDTRLKLKQVYHLYGFIEKLMLEVGHAGNPISLADHGAGKSYLGFILYDLFFNDQRPYVALHNGMATFTALNKIRLGTKIPRISTAFGV